MERYEFWQKNNGSTVLILAERPQKQRLTQNATLLAEFEAPDWNAAKNKAEEIRVNMEKG